MNHAIGWQHQFSSNYLQRVVHKKALLLPGYRERVRRTALVIVAEQMSRSGIGDVSASITLEPEGFESVYFLRFPGRDAIRLA